MPTQPTKPTPLVTDPHTPVADALRQIVQEIGEIEESQGGSLRIRIFHDGSFPWAEVLKALLYRDMKVTVTRQKADLCIEATT